MFRKIFAIFLTAFVLSSFSVVDDAASIKVYQFRWPVSIEPGQYLFNSSDLYFFDTGINCYLFKICPDIDSIFEASAQTVTFDKTTEIKYQAYLFTDNYEYLFVQIDKQQGWIRYPVPIAQHQKDFLKAFLVSRFGEPKRTCYVEVVPFKDPNKVFLSTTDDWYIGNIENHSISQIGTKGGRLEACRMLFHKNCVECYIDLGWGETLLFDENGKRCTKKVKTRRR
jgi:hypothetical protein